MDNNGYIYIIFLPHTFSDHIDSVINDYKKYYIKKLHIILNNTLQKLKLNLQKII